MGTARAAGTEAAIGSGADLADLESGMEGAGAVHSKGGPKEAACAGLTIDHALSLYGLTSWELVWDRGLDTKALLAWGGGTIVVAFKGTSSLENVITDLNVSRLLCVAATFCSSGHLCRAAVGAAPSTRCPASRLAARQRSCPGAHWRCAARGAALQLFKVAHPPRRVAAVTTVWGLRLIRSLVQVHRGFWRAWVGNAYDARLLGRVGELVAEMSSTSTPRVMLTGHSLGGATATLAAHALAQRPPGGGAHRPPVQPIVYTFGQPRVGNVAFATEYDRLVPHHFAVINDLDPVPRVPVVSRRRSKPGRGLAAPRACRRRGPWVPRSRACSHALPVPPAYRRARTSAWASAW